MTLNNLPIYSISFTTFSHSHNKKPIKNLNIRFFKTLLTLYYTISLQHIKLVASNFLCNLSISAVSKNFVYTCNKKPQTNKGKICENCWKTIDAIEKKICLTTWLTFTPQTNNNYKNKISSSIKWNLSKWQRALQREVKKLHRFSKKKTWCPK